MEIFRSIWLESCTVMYLSSLQVAVKGLARFKKLVFPGICIKTFPTITWSPVLHEKWNGRGFQKKLNIHFFKNAGLYVHKNCF